MKKALRALALVALTMAGACTGDTTGGGGAVGTTWVGLVLGADGVESGSLTVTAQTMSPAIRHLDGGIALAEGDVSTAGIYKRVTPSAATVNLSGTYNPGTDQLSVSGTGYTFTGAFDGQSRLEGTFTGPTGDGNFVTEVSTGTAQTFCGSYSGDDQGTWSFVVTGGEVHGLAQSSTSGLPPIPLNGIVSGQHITIYAPGTQTVFAEGDITGTSAGGTWSDPDSGDSGTWGGNTACD